nr:MAG TPA: hypothetical protein [Caudoviricetes sp.]
MPPLQKRILHQHQRSPFGKSILPQGRPPDNPKTQGGTQT